MKKVCLVLSVLSVLLFTLFVGCTKKDSPSAPAPAATDTPDTPAETLTPTHTSTDTATVPTLTNTATPTQTNTNTAAGTPAFTGTVTDTGTPTDTYTYTETYTITQSPSETGTATDTGTPTDTPQATNTFTPSPTNTTGASSWSVVVTPAISKGAVYKTRIAFAQDGTFYAAFRDGGKSQDVAVMRYDSSGNTWTGLGATATLNSDYSTSPYTLLADGTDISVSTYYYNNATWVRKWSGAGPWADVGSTTTQASWSNMALDSSKNPYVVYPYPGSNYDACVRKYDTGAWVGLGPDEFTGAGIESAVIALYADIPYVAYISSSNSRAYVRKYVSGTNSWDLYGTNPVSAGSCTSLIDLEFDASGNAFVMYERSASSGWGHTVKKYNSGTGNWDALGGDPFNGAYTSCGYGTMTLYNGEPYVFYTKSAYPVVKKYSGGSWQTLGTEQFLSSSTLENDIAVNPTNGDVYISFSDSANGGKATVMKFNP